MTNYKQSQSQRWSQSHLQLKQKPWETMIYFNNSNIQEKIRDYAQERERVHSKKKRISNICSTRKMCLLLFLDLPSYPS